MLLSNDQHATSSSKLVTEKFGMTLDIPPMESIDMLAGESGAKRKAKEALCRQLPPRIERQHL